MQLLKIFGLLILACVLGFAALIILRVGPRVQPSIQPIIATFEECAAAGNPVMESYPRQCATKDGRVFLEDVSPVQTSEGATSSTNSIDTSELNVQ